MTSPKPAPALLPAVRAWLKTSETPNSEATRAKAVLPLAEHFGHDTALADLDAGDIAEWFSQKWGESAPATWNNRLSSVRTLARYWSRRGWTGKESDLAGELDSRKARDVRPSGYLTSAEVGKLLAMGRARYATSVRNRALIMLLYRSGLRVSEALGIRPGDIDLAEHTIRLGSTKSGHAQTRAFHPTADAALGHWLDRRQQAGIGARAPVFCTLSAEHAGRGSAVPGSELSPNYVRDMLKRYARRAEIDKRVYPHMLRNTFAMELLREGQPLDVISRLLGHASIAVTARYLRGLTNHEAVASLMTADLAPVGQQAAAEAQPDLAAQVAELREIVAQLAAGKEDSRT